MKAKTGREILKKEAGDKLKREASDKIGKEEQFSAVTEEASEELGL
jgi:hypothetical protein